MTDSIEDIQGKLAAYIDGDCSSSERAEIVAHLARNPSHMEMMQELMEQRQLVRRLPREQAPPGLMEDFQGGLERESLLNDTYLLQNRRLHPRRLVPILAMAASVALVGGLAVAVYFSMPPQGKPLAINNGTKEHEDTKASGENKPVGEFGAAPRKGGGAEQPVELRQKHAGNGAVEEVVKAAIEEQFTLAPGQQPTLENAVAAPALSKVAEPLTTLDDAETVFITVTSTDLQHANGEVIRYLDEQRIDYTLAGQEGRTLASESVVLADTMKRAAADERLLPMKPTASVEGGANLGAPSNPNGFRGGVAGGGQGGGGGFGGGRRDLESDRAKTESEIAAKSAPAGPALQPPAPTPAQAGRPVDEGVDKLGQPERPVLDAAVVADARPPKPDANRSDPAQIEQKLARGVDGAVDRATVLTGAKGQERLNDARAFIAQAVDAPQAAPLAGRIIVARNMKREQVTRLASSLSQPDRGQWAAVQRARFSATLEAQVREQSEARREQAKDYVALDRLETAAMEKASTTQVVEGEYLFFNKPANDLLMRELGQPLGEVVSANDAAASDRRMLALETTPLTAEAAFKFNAPLAADPVQKSLQCVIILKESNLPAALTARTPATTPNPLEQPAAEPANQPANEPRAAAPAPPAPPATRPATQPSK